MINGLYLSAQGAQAQQVRLGVVSNNLANATTTGFKRDLALFQSHRPFDEVRGDSEDMPERLKDSLGGISIASIETDFTQNALKETGGSLDIALEGKGFLQVSSGSKRFLTRDGRMTIDGEGNFVTSGGAKVLSETGVPIAVDPNGGGITIASDGTVSQESAQGLQAVGQLALVQPQSLHDLKKVGNNLYENMGSEIPAGPELKINQGFLESSGVEPIKEMVSLIETSRAFEANLNMLKYQDEALGTLLNTVPRL